MKLSDNFSLIEFTRSETAEKNNVKNVPEQRHIDALRELCENVLQPLRDKLGKPVNVTSGYRNSHLNFLVNGRVNSQHVRGEAADINVAGMTAQELFDYIRESGIVYDQLIQESGQWVHISYRTRRANRKQALYARYTRKGNVRFVKA